MCVLALCLVLVHGWPAGTGAPSDLPFSDVAQEVIAIEEIVPTSQSLERRPPPPAPIPPVVVPNDRLIEVEIEWGTSALQIETPGDDAERQEGAADRATASRLPDTGARLLRAVQPGYPAEARKNDVRARVRVEVQVTASGRVSEAVVTGRWRQHEDGEQPVASLGYGLEDAALNAARRSLFRPAESNGEPVATRTTLTFTFGD